MLIPLLKPAIARAAIAGIDVSLTLAIAGLGTSHPTIHSNESGQTHYFG